MVNLLAVSAERGVAAVKDGRLLGVSRPLGPIPVLFEWLVSLDSSRPNRIPSR